MRRHDTVLAIVFLGICAVSLPAQAVAPLENAHAHNDYEHEHPLFDALDLGFNSVEADVYLVDGKLLVGHDRKELKPEKTLESLYLAPLRHLIQKNGGHVYPNGGRFILLIDVKNTPQETDRHIEKVLAAHAGMFTTMDGSKVRPGPITAVITGPHPPAARAALRSDNPRYAGLDGRIADLDSDAPSHFMPMISDNWKDHFHWNGDGPIPTAERVQLKEIVKKAHAAGRIVRFWATPENEHVWKELRAAGVDLIGTDQLARLATFLRGSEGK